MAKSQEIALNKQQIEKLQKKSQLVFGLLTILWFASTSDIFGQLQNILLLGRPEPSTFMQEETPRTLWCTVTAAKEIYSLVDGFAEHPCNFLSSSEAAMTIRNVPRKLK